MDASCGYNPSATWRSLIAGKSVLRKGLRRSIANGRSTGVWTDPWVPSEIPTIMPKPQHIETDDELVCELLTECGTEWDDGKLCARFNENICRRIKSIPPDIDQGEDKWIWEHDSKGTYSVKSGYRSEMAEFWGHFEPELDIDGAATMRRNKKKIANEVIRAEDLWPRVERIMEEIQTVPIIDDRTRSKPESFKWEKPEYPFKKLNVDAAACTEGGGALGGVLMDETGACVGVSIHCVQYPNEPSLLKALAIRRGLELAHQVGCTHVAVESDAMLVITNLVADLISKKARVDRRNFVWTDSVPLFLSEQPGEALLPQFLDYASCLVHLAVFGILGNKRKTRDSLEVQDTVSYFIL
ncbi:reverse transcriptase [Senna tora]|uniref:Reverse transcriptase n=1 Tax=Senna tora TaxID=362788 RepID=A0A835CHP1_9FABA|nr:reverse transcriptase [Senna tora]